jgi:hypothetical protein
MRWSNPLTGYGMTTSAALLSVRGQSSQVLVHMPEADDPATPAIITGAVIASVADS